MAEHGSITSGTARPIQAARLRRRALAGNALGGLLGATAAQAAGLNPDAELMAACVLFDEQERQIQAAYDDPRYRQDEAALEAALAPVEADQRRLLDHICRLQATTLAGVRARASTLLGWDEVLRRQMANTHEGGCWHKRMLNALIRDLTMSECA